MASVACTGIHDPSLRPALHASRRHGLPVIRGTRRGMQAAVRQQAANRLRMCGLGDDALSAWGDLASLVASSSGRGKTPFDDIANLLGDKLYCDMDGWHVKVKDLKGVGKLNMHQVLAEALGRKLPESDLDSRGLLEQCLKIMPVSLGGGKTEVTLWELVPTKCLDDCCPILVDYTKKQ